jgi:hypothetical protein
VQQLLPRLMVGMLPQGMGTFDHKWGNS